MLHRGALRPLRRRLSADPRTYGPQIRFLDSGFWDRMTEGMLHSIVAEPALVPEEKYLGPVYQMAAYGDVQRFYLMPGAGAPFLSLAMHATATGNVARRDRARWFAINFPQGTAPKPSLPPRRRRLGQQRGDGLHPQLPRPRSHGPARAGSPPRAAPHLLRPLHRPAHLPHGLGPGGDDVRLQVRLGDHRPPVRRLQPVRALAQGRVARQGADRLRQRQARSSTSEYHNTLAIQNRPASGAARPKSLQWFEDGTWERGGQFTLGMNAGDPRVQVSLGAGWVAAQADATPLYNRPSTHPGEEALEVTHASRSIAWLSPDVIVVYDRATTRSDGLFKRFFLVSGGDPEVSGKLTTFTTPKGQKLFVETLLPAAAVLTAAKAEPFNQLAEGGALAVQAEEVEDPSEPARRALPPRDSRKRGRFRAQKPLPVSLVQSSAGTPFAGAAVGTFAAVFPVDLGAAFTRVTYAVPSTVTAQLVGGLPAGGAVRRDDEAGGGAHRGDRGPGGGDGGGRGRGDRPGDAGVGGEALIRRGRFPTPGRSWGGTTGRMSDQLHRVSRLGFRLTEEQEMVAAAAREVASRRIAPGAAERDRTGEFPWRSSRRSRRWASTR